MKATLPIFLFLALFTCLTVSAQNIEFTENKGQWEPSILFQGKVSAGEFSVHSDGFTVLKHHEEDWESLHEIMHNRTKGGKPYMPNQPFNLRSHAYRVRFVGANSKARVLPDKPLDYYSNYFLGNDPTKWASTCRIYQGITIKDLYPNIDLRYYTDKGTLKYDFIVNPGGDPTDIELSYEGIDRLETKNGELLVGTSVGIFRELSPFTYQYGAEGRIEVKARYTVKDKTVRFSLGNYDPKSTLVIDPTLIFCSFTGSSADNWGFTATYGPDGAFYGGGIVFGGGFPTTPGAFQTSYGGGDGCFAGGFDIGVQKLSADGSTRIYSTYIGGSKDEMPQSLIVDPAGNLIVAGRSNSTNYPVTGNLIGPGGAWDITITKLNAAGSALIGSRAIGGGGNDGANISPCGGSGSSSLQQNYGDESRSEVNLDAAGNIYLASCTQSVGATAFPTTPGVFQPAPATFPPSTSIPQDGVVLKFNSNLTSLLFSTYLGGSGNDAAYVISINPQNGNLYVAGGTESNNLPGDASGTIGASYNGGIDGFVAIITPDGSSLIKKTYLGTTGIDQVFGIQFDRFGFPYVMGQTTGTWPNINVPASVHRVNGRQFIAKMQPNLSAYVYSMAFGKNSPGPYPDISPVAFLVDRCENVYVSGWGGTILTGYNSSGVQGLPVTPDAIKPTPDNTGANGQGQDFYFYVLKKNAASQLYGSFFGQNNSADHVDGGTSRFDQNGVIYQAICASCGNTAPFPTTPGSASPTKPASANCNLAMVKISFDFAGVASTIRSSINGVPRDTAGCLPLKVDFTDSLAQGVRYEWNFGDNTPNEITTAPSNSHIFTAVGIYNVMLVAIDSSTCNIRDTSYTKIRVGATEALPDFTIQKVGTDCNIFSYSFQNQTPAFPGIPFTATSFIWDFGDNTPRITTGSGPVSHTYASPGTYNVKLILVDTNYCNSPDSIVKQLRISAIVKADFQIPATGCAPYEAEFNNTSLGGQEFIWNFGDNSPLSTEVSPVHIYQNPGTYTITLTATDSASCNKTDTKTFTITIQGKPTANFTVAPQPPAVNTAISFTNLSSADAINFKWLFGDGDSLLTTSRNVITHEYNKTDTFQACLIATNLSGCVDTLCRPVEALIESAVDVPNAFTPLAGGINSMVYVRGFGFAKMKFTVYARWGEKVFETNDKKFGWDGRYKGKVLPMDVYAYTLDVEFTDGTRTRKTGDITLIR